MVVKRSKLASFAQANDACLLRLLTRMVAYIRKCPAKFVHTIGNDYDASHVGQVV